VSSRFSQEEEKEKDMCRDPIELDTKSIEEELDDSLRYGIEVDLIIPFKPKKKYQVELTGITNKDGEAVKAKSWMDIIELPPSSFPLTAKIANFKKKE
jgi:hypothetical protein